MATEVWAELYDRLAELIAQHRTTLIFVNQRRVAERAARHLAERLGEEHVTAHHGSLAREHRLEAEQRLKSGELKALVATSSLELGIDIGDIDLVCQLGSPRCDQRASCSAWAAPATRSARSRRAACSRCRSTTCWNAPRCSTRCSAASSTASACPIKPLDALAQQVDRRSGVPGVAARCAVRAPAPRRSVPRAHAAPSSSRWCRCWPTATPRGAAGAAPTCTTTR